MVRAYTVPTPHRDVPVSPPPPVRNLLVFTIISAEHSLLPSRSPRRTSPSKHHLDSENQGIHAHPPDPPQRPRNATSSSSGVTHPPSSFPSSLAPNPRRCIKPDFLLHLLPFKSLFPSVVSSKSSTQLRNHVTAFHPSRKCSGQILRPHPHRSADQLLRCYL